MSEPTESRKISWRLQEEEYAKNIRKAFSGNISERVAESVHESLAGRLEDEFKLRQSRTNQF